MSRVNGLLMAAVCCAAAWFVSVAEIPAGYYDGIEGLTTSSLKTKLHEIIRNHSKNNYQDLPTKSFIYTDVIDNGTADKSDDIWWDMYSDNEKYVYSGNSVISFSKNGLNREHCFPKSWWGGSTSVPAYTDLNHLYPSDASANGAKSNYPLGEVDPAGISFDNGVSVVGAPVSGQGGSSTKVFEPADEYKGDFARTYFYMVTCYQDYKWDDLYMAAQGDYPTLQGWAIDLLLRWHREDPVSQKEIDRNDVVFSLQSNRNPYIDFPDLAEYIWGDKMGEPFESEELPPVGDGVLITPENNSTIDFGNVVEGKSSIVTVPIRGTVTEALSLRIKSTGTDFSIPVNSIGWREINDSDGYELEIEYAPKSVGESTAELLLYDGGLKGTTSYTVNLRGVCVEMPVFDRPVATAATNLSPTGFRANWIVPENPEVIDCYAVNFSEYINGDRRDFTVVTDDDTPYLDFNDAVSGADYSYTVQSVRFGEMSGESNVIYVNRSGSVSGLEYGAGFSAFAAEGGVRLESSVEQTGVRIANMSGMLIKAIGGFSGELTVELQPGAYIIYTDQCRRPVKVMTGF